MQYRRIDVYVPESHLPAVRDAMAASGAGRLGEYSECCFQFPGEGRFRPSEKAEPFLGKAGGGVECVREWKLEMICPGEKTARVIAALKKAHPYETPAFQHWSVEIE